MKAKKEKESKAIMDKYKNSLKKRRKRRDRRIITKLKQRQRQLSLQEQKRYCQYHQGTLLNYIKYIETIKPRQ